MNGIKELMSDYKKIYMSDYIYIYIYIYICSDLHYT